MKSAILERNLQISRNIKQPKYAENDDENDDRTDYLEDEDD